jgi:hypothetical protein
MNGGVLLYKHNSVQFVTWLHALVTDSRHAIDEAEEMYNGDNTGHRPNTKTVNAKHVIVTKWIGDQMYVYLNMFDNVPAAWYKAWVYHGPPNNINSKQSNIDVDWNPVTGKLANELSLLKVTGEDKPLKPTKPTKPPKYKTVEEWERSFEYFLIQNPSWKSEWGDPRDPNWVKPPGFPTNAPPKNGGKHDIEIPEKTNLSQGGNRLETQKAGLNYNAPLVTTCAHHECDSTDYTWTPATGFVNIASMFGSAATMEGYWWGGVTINAGSFIQVGKQIGGMVLVHLQFEVLKPATTDNVIFELRSVDAGNTNNPITHVKYHTQNNSLYETVILNGMFKLSNLRSLGLYATDGVHTGNWHLSNSSFYCHAMQVLT